MSSIEFQFALALVDERSRRNEILEDADDAGRDAWRPEFLFRATFGQDTRWKTESRRRIRTCAAFYVEAVCDDDQLARALRDVVDSGNRMIELAARAPGEPA